MIPATLQARDLQVHVGTVRVCDAASLRFEPGSCWAILGVNGAGKTTLLHTLAGLRPPGAGEVRLDDRPLAELERRAIARRLGLMPQDTPDPFPATVLETALLGRHPWLSRWQWESADDEALARQALAELELAPLADRLVTTLSGGERRRLALATLQVQAPPVMLLDEPTNHLDLRHQHQVLGLLRERARAGHTVLMVLHDLNLAARYCDHALLLGGDGEILQGPVDAVLDPVTLSRLYGIPIQRIETDQQRLFVTRP